MQLQIHAVHQSQRLEFLFRQLARQPASDLVAEFAHTLVDERAIEVVVNIHGVPSILARQRDGRSLKPNPLAQIARQYLLLPRERNRRDIGIDRLELVGKRGSEKLDCCWRRRHHRCRGKILRRQASSG